MHVNVYENEKLEGLFVENTLLKVGHPMTDDAAKLDRDKKGFVNFLDQYLGQKKLLVVRNSGNEKEIEKDLAAYAKKENYTILHLDGEKITAKDVKKLLERSEEKLLVLIQHLSKAERLGVIEEASLFRAILDLADPANDEFLIREESAFLFLADEDFPSTKLSTVSLTWAYESVFFDGRAFREKVLSHMERYREKFLRIKEEVSVRGKSYGHILPEKNYHENFLSLVREDLITSPYLSGIHWHRFSHHLNSSQVLGVNFFYPLLRKGELKSFLQLFHLEDAAVFDSEHLSFSKLSPVESSVRRKSCFDFHADLQDEAELYVLSNYTDGCFGRAEKEAFSDKYETVYQPLLLESDMIAEDYKNQAFFMEEYRYMRSLLHLKEKSSLLVLIPRENYLLREKALYFKDQVLTDKGREHFYPVVWEDMLDKLLSNLSDPELSRYYETELKDKYFRY